MRSPNAVLAVGDYKAKLIEQKNPPLNTYDLNSIYELLLPDGRTRQFTLVGITE